METLNVKRINVKRILHYQNRNAMPDVTANFAL